MCPLKLSDDGVVDLDAPIENKPFALRQLLTHTSRLPDFSQLPEYRRAVQANATAWSRYKMLEMAFLNGMLFEPDQG